LVLTYVSTRSRPRELLARAAFSGKIEGGGEEAARREATGQTAALRPPNSRNLLVHSNPMVGELREGMRTLIERDGQEFELPQGHTIDIYRGQATYVALDAPGGGGSIFTVPGQLEERADAVVVHLVTKWDARPRSLR
jgi:hypothetical protein